LQILEKSSSNSGSWRAETGKQFDEGFASSRIFRWSFASTGKLANPTAMMMIVMIRMILIIVFPFHPPNV
jgi:hypothetical protein